MIQKFVCVLNFYLYTVEEKKLYNSTKLVFLQLHTSVFLLNLIGNLG